jgi:hypothetical protein
MPNKIETRENNRANEDNQATRHHHTPGAGSSFPTAEEQPTQQNAPDEHEYYPEFDQTGRGVNPEKKIIRE